MPEPYLTIELRHWEQAAAILNALQYALGDVRERTNGNVAPFEWPDEQRRHAAVVIERRLREAVNAKENSGA